MIIFGGAFSPIHLGHLWVIQQLREEYPKEDIWVVPAFAKHRTGQLNTIDVSCADRLTMCGMALQDFFDMNNFKSSDSEHIILSDVEIENNFCFTYETIKHLRYQGHTDMKIVIGNDWDVTKFKRYDALKDVCKFLTVKRESYDNGDYPAHIYLNIENNISSTMIRDRIKKGLSIKGLVTPRVEKYIKENKLYAEI